MVVESGPHQIRNVVVESGEHYSWFMEEQAGQTCGIQKNVIHGGGKWPSQEQQGGAGVGRAQ